PPAGNLAGTRYRTPTSGLVKNERKIGQSSFRSLLGSLQLWLEIAPGSPVRNACVLHIPDFAEQFPQASENPFQHRRHLTSSLLVGEVFLLAARLSTGLQTSATFQTSWQANRKQPSCPPQKPAVPALWRGLAAVPARRLSIQPGARVQPLSPTGTAPHTLTACNKTAAKALESEASSPLYAPAQTPPRTSARQ